MKKLMIVGAGDFQLPLVQAAAKRCEVILVAPAIGPEFDGLYSHSYRLDVREKDAILDIAKQEQIDGIITDQTDIPVRTVSYVAEKLGLPGIGYETGCLFTDKNAMRDKLAALGLPLLPNQKVFSLAEAAAFFDTLNGDAILKPIDTQGSRGVARVSTQEELAAAYDKAAKYSSDHSVIIEKYASGREFVVEGVAFQNEFCTAICGDTTYFTSMPDTFAAKSRIFPSIAPEETVRQCIELNNRIAVGFGISQGITHGEYIMDGDQVYLIEIAARGGGVYISSDLISLSTGLDVEDFLVDIALGQQNGYPDLKPQLCCCGYMACFIPSGTVTAVSGVDEVQALPYVHRNQLDRLHSGLTSGANTDKTSRLALIVSAADRTELNQRMEHIKSILHVTVQTETGISDLIWD